MLALASSIQPASARRASAAMACACGLALAGCGAKSEDPHDLPPEPSNEAGPPLGEGLPLPFVVDDHFHPSGCYALEGCPVTIDTGCEVRAPGAQGQCYRFKFVAGQEYAGVFFQNVDAIGGGNWGQAPGTVIVPGARAVSFYAEAGSPGQLVNFKVGGIGDPDLMYVDDLNVGFEVTLDTTLQRYSIPLEGLSYEHVLSAFSWHISRLPDQAGDIDLILDDVRWE